MRYRPDRTTASFAVRSIPAIQLFMALFVGCISMPDAFAQPTDSVIEEVVVTASFRDARLSNTPISVSVIQPNQNSSTVQHLEEILGRVPNVKFASGASRARFIQIRGIGERGQFAETLNPSVGLLLDGVDLSGIGTAATLFDVGQVEVLRGPQGTLYGANALAGLINVKTNDPTEEFTGRLRMDGGNYAAFGAGAVLSGSLTEDLGVRFSANRYRDDGFIDNTFLNRDNTNNRDEESYRLKFKWQRGTQTWRLSTGHININNGYDAFSLDNDRNTRSDQPGRDEQTTNYASLNLVARGSEHFHFEATATIANSELDYGYDEDWTFTGFDPIGYTSTDLYQRDRETSTLDLRWQSQPGAELGGAWDWTVGVFALHQTVDLDRTYTFAGPFSNTFDVDRQALYGEVSRDLSDRWRLTLGARVERHSSDYEDSNGVSFDPDNTLWGGRAVAEYTLVDDNLLYFSASQGYKTGGFNQDGTLNAARREFDEETLWNLEVGYKAALLDGRLNLRAALFRMQRDDIQLSKSDTRPIPGSPGAVEFIEFIDNASAGFNQGIEVELDYAATDRLTLFANLGFLDTEYDDEDSGRPIDGRDQAHAPRYQYYAGFNYALTDAWSLQMELEGKDDFFYSVTHDTEADGYDLWNMNLTYVQDYWRLNLWGRNLSEKDYNVRGFLFGNDPRDFYTARPFTQLGAPRQFGATLEMDL